MILTVKFPGLMLKNIQVFRNQEHFGSLKIGWPFSTKATINCREFKWEIKEIASPEKKVQITDLTDKELVGETAINEKVNVTNTNQAVDPLVSVIKIGGNEYVLSENLKSPHQYAWINNNRGEIVHYDNINLESSKSLPFTFKSYIMTCMPDNSTKEYLILLFLGLYILRQRAIKGTYHRVEPQAQESSSAQ